MCIRDRVKKFKQNPKLQADGTALAMTDPDKWLYDRTIGNCCRGQGRFNQPAGIAIDGNDQVYVGDFYNHWVQIFDGTGKFVGSIGSTSRRAGNGKNRFTYPAGIAIKRGGPCTGNTIHVADNRRISKYLDSVAVATGGAGAGPEQLAKARIAYLRGDRSNEDTKGYKFRKRKSVLGDIIHSTAIYVGRPDLVWPDSKQLVFGGSANKYLGFINASKGRKPVVYVGANDGMLHGFYAVTGKELLAYVPGNLYSTLSGEGYHYLTDPEYKHRYYVNATPVVSDVFIKKSGLNQGWRTVLVGSEGAGGRGIFALDVTEPANFTEGNAAGVVLWEFNNSHDEHLGYTLSTPTIAPMPNGRWAAIFGNGYQDTATDTATDKTAGEASLVIVYLDGGSGGQWVKGKDYLRISTGVGSVANRNGLSTPNVVDTDNDAIADRVYAGDVQGNLWVFDLSNKSDTQWKVAFNGQPLFDGDAKQPITAQPEIIRHPSVNSNSQNTPNLMVYFGTGQYITAGDNTNTDVQAFYAVWDRGDGNRKKKHLLKQALLSTSKTDGRVTAPNIWQEKGKNYKGVGTGNRYGWYLELPKGERVVTAAHHRTELIHFNTLTPSDIRPCSAGGTGWMMSLRASSGGPPEDAAFDFNNDNTLTTAGDTAEVNTSVKNEKVEVGYAGKKYATDKGVPTAVSIIGTRRYSPGSGTDEASKVSSSLLKAAGAGQGRISWQQVREVDI